MNRNVRVRPHRRKNSKSDGYHRVIGHSRKLSNKNVSQKTIKNDDFELVANKLLSIGGESVQGYNYGVGMLPTFESEKMLRKGKLNKNDVIYEPEGEEGGCLDTVTLLHDGMDIYYGYALNNDIWVEHYWLVDDNGNVVEKTPLPYGQFEEYFGMDVTEDMR